MEIQPGRFVSRWPFLTIGIVTFALYLVTEFVPGFGVLAPLVRLLIAPIWIMRTLEMIVGIGALPGVLQLFIALPLLFLPYVLIDLLIARIRERRLPAQRAA
jgi:hypothetical protein